MEDIITEKLEDVADVAPRSQSMKRLVKMESRLTGPQFPTILDPAEICDVIGSNTREAAHEQTRHILGSLVYKAELDEHPGHPSVLDLSFESRLEAVCIAVRSAMNRRVSKWASTIHFRIDSLLHGIELVQ